MKNVLLTFPFRFFRFGEIKRQFIWIRNITQIVHDEKKMSAEIKL